MSFPLSLPTEVLALTVFVVCTLALFWLQAKKYGRLEKSEQRNRQETAHRLELADQQLVHADTRLAEIQAQNKALLSKAEILKDQRANQAAKLAVLESVSDEVHLLKRQLSLRNTELSELQATAGAKEATYQAEKTALEEKVQLLKDAREQLNTEFRVLANKIFEEKQQQFNQQSQVALKASVDPLKAEIESFRKKVEDAYDKENAERNKLVGSIVELQKQTLQIGQDAINLTNALKGDNKAQGNWGEVILERLLEESGLQKGREYDVQVGLKDEQGRRRNPDVILRLPEGKDIVIDSKVSLIHYERSVSQTDEGERAADLKQHVASVRAHIQQLSGKSYEKLEGIRSLDFVFLFIPVEAAFMSALQQDSSLFQEAYTKHIIVVSPTTLLASLRTVENIWRYEKQNRNAEEIAKQAGGLHDQFVLLFESFEDIGKQLDKATGAFETTRRRWVSGRGNLMRRVDGLRELGAKTKKRVELNVVEDSDGEPSQTKIMSRSTGTDSEAID
jgi:DNA recombination protein RmuC